MAFTDVPGAPLIPTDGARTPEAAAQTVLVTAATPARLLPESYGLRRGAYVTPLDAPILLASYSYQLDASGRFGQYLRLQDPPTLIEESGELWAIARWTPSCMRIAPPAPQATATWTVSMAATSSTSSTETPLYTAWVRGTPGQPLWVTTTADPSISPGASTPWWGWLSTGLWDQVAIGQTLVAGTTAVQTPTLWLSTTPTSGVVLAYDAIGRASIPTGLAIGIGAIGVGAIGAAYSPPASTSDVYVDYFQIALSNGTRTVADPGFDGTTFPNSRFVATGTPSAPTLSIASLDGARGETQVSVKALFYRQAPLVR